METRQITVKGRVQGVGYRDALRRQAEKLGVTGWVRNRSDGSVEALLQGSAEALDALVSWARRGPPAASVGEVLTGVPAAEHDRAYTRFERWPSA